MNTGRMLPMSGAVASGGLTESGRCISIPMGRSAAVPITFTVVGALACASADPRVPTVEASNNRATDLVTALFVAILRRTLARSSAGEVRVDPRPLRPDPGLATLRGLDEVALKPTTLKEPGRKRRSSSRVPLVGRAACRWTPPHTCTLVAEVAAEDAHFRAGSRPHRTL